MNRNGKSELVYLWGEILRNMIFQFLHTTELLRRHQRSQEDVKKATKFFKGHSKDHSSIL